MSNEFVKTITNDNFDSVVAQSNGYVLVDFWAPWCGPCRIVGPVIDELAEDYDGQITVGKVNVDECEALATKFQIMNIPTVALFKNGEVVDKLIGSNPKDRFEEMLDSHLGT